MIWAACTALAQEAGEWVSLFDGTSLEGWEQLNEQVEGLCSDLGRRVYPEGAEEQDLSADDASQEQQQ